MPLRHPFHRAIHREIHRPLSSPLAGGGGAAPFIPVNLIGVSEQFDHASWAKANLTVSANVINGPTGTLTADKLIASVVNSDHKISKGTVVTNGETYTFSVYLRQAEYRWALLYCAALKGQYFDLQLGVKGGTFVGAPPASTIVDAGGGWWRCSISAVSTSTLFTAFIYCATANGSAVFAGNESDGIHAWGAQLEIGSIANTYVPVP